MITFSTKAYIAIKLNAYSTKDSLIQAIGQVKYKPGHTNTSGSLWLMRKVFFSKDNGARVGYPKFGVMITDGESSIDTDRLWEEARLTQKSHITMIVLGIGNSVNRKVS